MKFLAFILCMIGLTAFAQTPDWSGNVYKIGYKYPGYVILNSGDTLNGYIMHGGRAQNQKQCQFFSVETLKKPLKTYKPEEVKEYFVGDKLYRTIPYSGGLMAKALRFVLVEKGGEISIFNFYDEDPAIYDDQNRTMSTVYYKWHDSNYPKPFTSEKFALSFAKNIAELVADYPELSTKVKNKEKGYGLIYLNAIIDEYNAWYAAKN